MRLRTFLVSSAAFAAIAIIVPVTVPTNWNPVASAEAATSISFSVFYDGLADYGDWVDHDGDYVFVPVVSDRDWRPYREGHWVYARGHGWTWVSDERFGWATYHYGRWGFDEEIGWYWIPGKRWAPAWVSWRRSGDHVAWAPLPPHHGDDDDISITVNVGSIPDYYWVAVPTRSFLDVNLTVVIINDDRERRRIVHDSEFVGSVNIENNIVVNNVIDLNFVEKNTGKKVKEVAVKETNDPASAKSSDAEVAVFNGTLEADKSAKPSKLKALGEVEQNQAESRKKLQSEAEGQAATPTPEAPAVDQAAKPDDKKKKKLTPEQAEGAATEEAPATEQASQPDNKKKKKLTPEQAEGAATEEAPATEQAAQPDNKKKKKVTPEQAEGAGADDMPVGSITKPAEQQTDKKKPAAGEEPAAKKDKKAVPCDPATDSECVPH